MKRFILLLSIACLPMLGIQARHHVMSSRKAHVAMVYVCTGPYAKVYHSSPDCRGLNRCSGNIKKVSLKHAQQMGRRACEICY
jgi:hypothetical protein